MNYENKIKISNKIYPLFSGMSADLLFWVTVNTFFLTTVKGFSAAQISSLTAIGTLISIIIYPFVFRIIKRIGNIASIKLGTILLLSSALLLTFSKQYFGVAIGYILYYTAFSFKSMDNVILRKNLKYENREEDYIRIQNKRSLVYSFLNMVIAFISGFLFNINNYLPMICCIAICVLNIILSNFLYEYNNTENTCDINKEKPKMSVTKLIFLIFLLFALMYAVIDVGQANTKLFIQYKLSSFLDIDRVAIYLSFIIAISRIVRVVSDFIFAKFCDNKNKKLLDSIDYSLIMAFVLIIIGNLLKVKVLSIILMAMGFFIFLAVRDPFENYMKTLLLNNCDEQFHEQAITYLTLARRTGNFVISTLITLLLLQIDMLYIMIFLLLISIFNILIIKRIYRLVESK